MIRALVIAAVGVQMTSLAWPLLGSLGYLRSRALLDAQRLAIAAAIAGSH